MRAAIVVVAVVLFGLAATSAAAGAAQTPQPARASVHAQAPTAEVDASPDSDADRPWARLAIFVPLSGLLGAGAVAARRVARNRGWLGDS